MQVDIKQLPHGEGLPLPQYVTTLSAGLDLSAAVESPVTLHPGERILVPTGFIYAIPKGYEGQIRPRSGLALKQGITVLNTPGTIDADYRGEVKVILINKGQETFVIERGARIAQMVIAPVIQVQLNPVMNDFNEHRGGGFGSTGV